VRVDTDCAFLIWYPDCFRVSHVQLLWRWLGHWFGFRYFGSGAGFVVVVVLIVVNWGMDAALS
jgi:hypothetical protein